jgi:hypothetical protein
MTSNVTTAWGASPTAFALWRSLPHGQFLFKKKNKQTQSPEMVFGEEDSAQASDT